MNGVARCFVAGLALAALARLGEAVAQSPPRGVTKSRLYLANPARDRGARKGKEKSGGLSESAAERSAPPSGDCGA